MANQIDTLEKLDKFINTFSKFYKIADLVCKEAFEKYNKNIFLNIKRGHSGYNLFESPLLFKDQEHQHINLAMSYDNRNYYFEQLINIQKKYEYDKIISENLNNCKNYLIKFNNYEGEFINALNEVMNMVIEIPESDIKKM